MTKKEAIDHFGGLMKTARALRIHENSVRRWPEELTDTIAYRVELASGGRLLSNETKMSKGIDSCENQ